MQIKLISTRKGVHLASFWQWGFLELGSGFVNFHTRARRSLREILGSLSNEGGDVNENGKKTIGFDWQNNNSARASRI